ncbi:MAG: DUF4249 domain-containing protein [candidate division KSB1 bacterium]|nr:DUF4249 domain-containing protein [candidate division KSB1 bacterium]
MKSWHQSKILISCLLALVNCTSLNPVSPGPQPHYLEEVKHQPLLNVFGILRPDSLEGWPLSYVHLEFSYPTDDIPDSSIIPDAQVQIIKLEGTTVVDSFDFVYTDWGIFPTREYRNASFFPQEGSYRLICRKEGFPVLSAETTVPNLPLIREETIERQGATLSFHILRDEQVGVYEVVLEGNNWLVKDRFLRPPSGDVPISFSIPNGPCQLTIYAFDLNLSEYLTVNLSIKPNIYQKDFSMVTNGLGCFGAMNIYRKMLSG